MTTILLPEDAVEGQGTGLAYSVRRCFIGVGVGFGILGALTFGHLAAASMISTFIIGLIVAIGALLHLGQAIGVRRAHAGGLWAASGICYLLAGAAILVQPLAGHLIFMLALAILLVVSGISRLVIGVQHRAEWVLLSGAASIVAGAVIGMDWPENSLWIIGSMVGVDLVVQGITLAATGLTGHFIAVVTNIDEAPGIESLLTADIPHR